MGQENSHTVTEAEMLTLLLQVARNLNEAGFNDSVGRLLMQIVSDLQKPIPHADVTFLNAWCERLETASLKEDPMEVFDLVSDLSQIMKRFVIAKENPDCNLEANALSTGDCENVA